MPVYSPLTTSILLDGVDQKVDWGSVTIMKPERTDPFSWVIWMKSTSAVQENLFSQIRASAGWVMNINSLVNGDFRQIGPRASLNDLFITSIQAGGAPSVDDDEWHMLGMTTAGADPLTTASLEMYIDDNHLTGGEVLKVPAGNVINTTIFAGGALTAGSVFAGANFYAGNLLHCAGWDIELTPTQMIDEVFGNGQPQDLQATSFVDPVFWDTLGDGDALGVGNMIDLISGNNGELINGDGASFVLDVPGAPDPGLGITTQYGKGSSFMRPTVSQIKAYGRGGFRRNDA